MAVSFKSAFLMFMFRVLSLPCCVHPFSYIVLFLSWSDYFSNMSELCEGIEMGHTLAATNDQITEIN